MALFGKKKPAGIPTEIVIQLRQQGTGNDQIVEQLKGQGYASSQIYDAMSQADIKGAVEVPAATEAPAQIPAAPPAPPEQMPAEMPPPEQMPAEMPPPEGLPPLPEAMPQQPAIAREEIEEIVEPIIDEKWEELMKNVDKIIAWKEATESKIAKLEQMIKDLASSFEELHTGVLAKIGEYDKSIKDVGSDIKAMEGVFKKVLPTFTDNVSELSRITKKLKK
jgi:hypothetical protein